MSMPDSIDGSDKHTVVVILSNNPPVIVNITELNVNISEVGLRTKLRCGKSHSEFEAHLAIASCLLDLIPS